MRTDDDSDNGRAFICRHPSIRNLQFLTVINELQFKDIAKSLVNLRVLLIGGFIDGLFKEIDPDVPFPPFPKLKKLTFDLISLKDFEQLLKIRCLPREPSDTNKTQRILDLGISCQTSELNSVPWRQSALLAHIPQTVKKWGDIEGIYTVTLKMPN
jgi:hypothetical protein